SSALEALLKQLLDDATKLNASTTRTTAATIDFLFALVQNPGLHLDTQEPRVLVLDDEPISRRAVVTALEKVKLSNITEPHNPNQGLTHTQLRHYDLIVLDINMPELDGLEFCRRVRNSALNKKTAIIFVTSMNDFETRAMSTLSGGNDFITKPFLFIELG